MKYKFISINLDDAIKIETPHSFSLMDQIKGLPLVIQSNGQFLCQRCLVTADINAGLLPYDSLPNKKIDGMLFNYFGGIHMLGMNYESVIVYKYEVIE